MNTHLALLPNKECDLAFTPSFLCASRLNSPFIHGSSKPLFEASYLFFFNDPAALQYCGDAEVRRRQR